MTAHGPCRLLPDRRRPVRLEKNAAHALASVDEGVQDRSAAFRCSLIFPACC